MKYTRALAAAAALAFATAASAQVTLAGAKFDPEATVAGQKLLLNGAGIRYKAIFKVYAMALYTPKAVRSNQQVLDPKLAKRLQLVALRDVGGDEFGRLFARAIEENATRDEFAKSIGAVVRMGEIEIDQTGREIRRDGQRIDITGREWAVLDQLLGRRNRIVTKEQIEEALYPFGAEIESNAIEVHVSRLRKKLGRDFIETVRGVGYRLGAG